MKDGGSLVQRVHIDTDPGLDDLLALALVLASPELALEGITTVAGNASLEAVTENTRRFLALVGLEIPLGRGAPGPLSLERVHAEHIHGANGRGGVALPEPAPLEVGDAQAVLRHSLRERGVDCLVALGPLTNVAALLRSEPELFEKVEIVWMGGTLDRGNATPVAEFNAYADPEAVAVVLASGVSLRMIGLDVTRHVGIRGADLLESPFGDGRVGHALWEILRTLMDAGRPVHGEPHATLHDPAAVVAAALRDCFRYERLDLAVRVEEGRERGRLVPREPARPPGVQVATEVRAHDVAELFVRRVARWCQGSGSR